jgi:toxin ParE1/3/4
VAYLVRIAKRAERDLISLYDELDAANSSAAQRWYTGLTNKILSLASRPNRCPVTPEDRRLKHLLYGRKPHIYRVIYRVDENHKLVHILHIRHGARKQFVSRD